MKVALFFDGKNFYSGWRERASRQPLDFTLLSKWLVKHVGGDVLWGAYYYTGIETGTSSTGTGQTALTSFLDNLEMLPGYFVHRFSRRSKSYHCRECSAENYFTQENEVDTTMVADMLRLAAVGAFDILVLMSGDADHAPAVEGVRALGRQVYVATWGGVGLSRRIRKVAFDHIDLVDTLQECSRPDTGITAMFPDEILPSDGLISGENSASDSSLAETNASFIPREPHLDTTDLTHLLNEYTPSDALVDEIRRAEAKFPTGYVGVNFFVNRWQASTLNPDPEIRRKLIDQVVREERIELYTTDEGTKALRVKRANPAQS